MKARIGLLSLLTLVTLAVIFIPAIGSRFRRLPLINNLVYILNPLPGTGPAVDPETTFPLTYSTPIRKAQKFIGPRSNYFLHMTTDDQRFRWLIQNEALFRLLPARATQTAHNAHWIISYEASPVRPKDALIRHSHKLAEGVFLFEVDPR